MELIIRTSPAGTAAGAGAGAGAADFKFDSASTSPYRSLPSTPERFGNIFYSAPTSPRSRRYFNDSSSPSTAAYGGSPSAIPFDWEEKPGISKSKAMRDERDFEFDFSEQLERTSLSADELFDGGKIKPLKPPPRLQSSDCASGDSPRSPISPRMLPSRQRKKDIDPFAIAIEQTRRKRCEEESKIEQQRGRERKCNPSPSSSRHKGTRSWSPFRVSDVLFEPEPNQPKTDDAESEAKRSSSWRRGYRKWRLKDFLLFRSASEGRATGKDPLKKFAYFKKNGEDGKNSSFRSVESFGSVSAHEMHYTVNRTVSEQMRKKTFLPYNMGLLGCLGFNPAVDEISRGLGSMTRG